MTDEFQSIFKVHSNARVTKLSRCLRQIPTYPSGHWLFGFAAKKRHPVAEVAFDAWEKLEITTRYYNTKLHQGAFALPTYVEEMLKSVEPEH